MTHVRGCWVVDLRAGEGLIPPAAFLSYNLAVDLPPNQSYGELVLAGRLTSPRRSVGAKDLPMNETKWLTGVDGEDMLEFVADRLSPRQWVFLSAALRPQAVGPPPRRRAARGHRTRRAGHAPAARRGAGRVDAEDRRGRPGRRRRGRAAPSARSSSRATRTPPTSTRPVLSRPNQIAPAFPLFQAASRNARNAIEGIANAITEAAQAVRGLYARAERRHAGAGPHAGR